MNRISRISCGFTLIELLFVIAIIGVLASLGLSILQKRTQEFKVRKTTAQIQHILQASMAYYVDKREWPNRGKSDGNDDKGFYTYYVGKNIVKNPFASDPNDPYYHWSEAPSNDKNIVPRFYVETKLPNLEIAKRVAALLPVAETDRDLTKAYVTIPGQAEIESSVRIIDSGTTHDIISSKTSPYTESIEVPQVNCNRDEYANIFVALNSIESEGFVKNFNGDIKTNVTINYKNGDIKSHCIEVQNGNGKYDCDFTVTVERGGKPIKTNPYVKANVSYFTMCVKKR